MLTNAVDPSLADPAAVEESFEVFSPVLDLNQRALDALVGYGLTAVDDIEARSDAELLRLSGINESTLVHIRARVIDYRRSQRHAHRLFVAAGKRLTLVPAATTATR